MDTGIKVLGLTGSQVLNRGRLTHRFTIQNALHLDGDLTQVDRAGISQAQNDTALIIHVDTALYGASRVVLNFKAEVGLLRLLANLARCAGGLLEIAFRGTAVIGGQCQATELITGQGGGQQVVTGL